MLQDVQRWLDDVRQKHEGSLTLSLRNYRDDGRGDPVDGWELPKDLEASGIWAKIEEAAQQDADLLGGTQRYAVVALAGKEVIGRRLFNVEGKLDSGTPADPANEKGIIAQLMRQNEAKDRFAMQVMMKCSGGLILENARLQSRVEKLERRDEERALTFEKVRTKEHARELAEKVAEHDMRMKQEVVHGLRMLMPYAVSKVTGTQVATGTPRPEDEQIRALLESIRPEQFGELSKIFNPFQQAAILTLWQEYNAKGEKQLSAGSSTSGSS